MSDTFLREDLRGAPRYAFVAPVQVTAEDGRRFAADLVNLSLSGAFMRSDQLVRVNGRCHLEIFSPGLGDSLRAEVRVVRVDDVGIAVRFLALDDRGSARLRAWISRCVRRSAS